MLLVGPPMPDTSRVMTQTKRDTLVLQVGGLGVELTTPYRKNNLFRNPWKDDKQMLAKEVWKPDLTVATCNVRATLIPGKMQGINKEMTVPRQKKRKTSFEMGG